MGEDSKGYLRRWAAKDAQLKKSGFGPSKLGPGVPAITHTSWLGGVSYQDDCGFQIPAGEMQAKR